MCGTPAQDTTANAVQSWEKEPSNPSVKVDRAVWRSVEPGTPSPVKRLEVCARLNAAGIPAAC
ncbi:MAG: hypothetical protein M3513_05150 [Actinomycetota bacterium]|nr:hypothetical protein [Actinomycetota bacterium]